MIDLIFETTDTKYMEKISRIVRNTYMYYFFLDLSEMVSKMSVFVSTSINTYAFTKIFSMNMNIYIFVFKDMNTNILYLEL